MRVKAVLFDLFDTLLLIKDGETFYIPALKRLHEFLAKNEVNVSFEEFKRVYFETRDRLYAETAKNLEEPHFNVRISQTLQKLGYDYAVSHPIVNEGTASFAKEFMHYVVLDDDAIVVLKELQGKCKLGLVSNFAIPECLRELLGKFGLEEFFAVTMVSGTINKRKPSPEIFEKALKALDVDASEAVFVGDTPSMDVEGAKSFGMRAILIERNRPAIDGSELLIYKSPEDDKSIKPDKVIKRLNELLAILEEC